MAKPHSSKRKEVPPIGWMELIVGAILVLFGASLLSDPIVSYKGGVELDMSPFNVPAAAVSIGIGIYLLWNSMSKTVPDGADEKSCPKCGESIDKEKVSDKNCPACGSEFKD